MATKKPMTLEKALKKAKISAYEAEEEISVIPHTSSIEGNEVWARVILCYNVNGQRFEFNDVLKFVLTEVEE